MKMNVDQSTLDRECWLREESALSSVERFIINVSKESLFTHIFLKDL